MGRYGVIGFCLRDCNFAVTAVVVNTCDYFVLPLLAALLFRFFARGSAGA
jgi:hypothetical protein